MWILLIVMLSFYWIILGITAISKHINRAHLNDPNRRYLHLDGPG